MTREQVRSIYPDATEEQITAFLNQHNAEVTRQRAETDRYKKEAADNAEYKEKYEEAQQQELTATERLQKDLETEQAKSRSLEQRIALAESRQSYAASMGISLEDAAKVLRDDGTMDYEALKTIQEAYTNQAIQAKLQEQASLQTSPESNPNAGVQGSNSVSPDIAFVQTLFSSIDPDQGSKAKAARDYYS